MIGYIDNYDFKEMEPMRYYAPPASWPDKKKRENVQTKIFSGDWLGAEKKDGYFSKFVKDEDGNMFLLSRSRNTKGEFPDKYEYVPHLHNFFESLPNKTCILGELYLPSNPGSSNVTTILGCKKDKAIERQEKDERLHFYVFDVLAYDGVNLLNLSLKKRIEYLSFIKVFATNIYIEVANYVNGQKLWDTLGAVLQNSGEGMVITNMNAKYTPGKRSAKDTLKVKKEVSNTIDCFFTGRATRPTKEYTGKEIDTWQYWERTTTGEHVKGDYYKAYVKGEPIVPITKPYFNDWAGSLEIGVYDNDKVVPIGFLSGLTDEIKANFLDYKMRPIEITCMQVNFNKDGIGLRHPKFLNFRDDLAPNDCTLDKIKG